jgi:uncharacterized peroxidase-related enzyme
MISDPSGFLSVSDPTPEAQHLFDDDVAEMGYVMNVSRLWAHQPELQAGLFDMVGKAAAASGLTRRDRGILVTACASTLGDAYCALAWGARLATDSDGSTAGGVLRGDDHGLTERERALAGWARKVTSDPNGTGAADVEVLREAGYEDAQILAITVFVALRIAFSTVNDALGAQPDEQMRTTTPAAVLDGVTFGRPIAGGS